jgi:hypothetical protein
MNTMELSSRIDELTMDMERSGMSRSQIAKTLRRAAERLASVDPVIIPISIGELCRKLKRGRFYIWTMRRAGYTFTHGKRTTLESALRWLEENPKFSSYKFANR